MDQWPNEGARRIARDLHMFGHWRADVAESVGTSFGGPAFKEAWVVGYTEAFLDMAVFVMGEGGLDPDRIRDSIGVIARKLVERLDGHAAEGHDTMHPSHGDFQNLVPPKDE